MGETEFWDEFVDPEKHVVMEDVNIQFNRSFDPIIESLHKKSLYMSLPEIASQSKPGELFDIETKYKNVGGLLLGKYATSRSAGNCLAGYNASTGKLIGMQISFETFQKMVGGALHIETNYGRGNLTKRELMSIFLTGRYDSSRPYKFVAPTWGEFPYQYRVSGLGRMRGRNNS